MPIVSQPLGEAQGVDGISLPSAGLKSYTELNRTIIASGLSSLYRLWLLCRLLDPDGSGVVEREALRAAMEAVGLSASHLRRARAHPQSRVFFTFHQHKIDYRSLESVCIELGVEPGRAVYIPVSCLGGLEAFHAHLYAAWMGGQDALYISREKLSELFGVSADTQRRWERLCGVRVTYNVVEVLPGDEEAAAAHLPQDARLDERLDRHHTWEYQGKTYYRTVNRYQAPQMRRGAVGNVRKVTRSVRRVKPVDETGDGTRHGRIFFGPRTMPTNPQEKRGCSLRATRRVVSTDRGVSDLWRFSRTRPVARREVMV